MPKQYSKPEQVIDPSKRYRAVITTEKGDIELALDPSRAPKTVNNFVFLAQEGYYDGLTFHRVVDDFVIQGGCPEGSGRGGPGYRFEDEPVQGEYTAGAVAMANSGPNTNGSQFFITVAPTPHLTGNHTIFGEVVEGQDIAVKIANVQRNRQDRPVKDVVLESITIERS